MPFENTPLEFLFVVLFDDGTALEQTPEDASTLDPTKSAYHEVLQSGKKVRALVLKSVDGATQAAVSLEDGHFEVNGEPFFLGNSSTEGGPRDLVYFRRNLRHFNIDLTVQLAHDIEYHFGWSRVEDGVEVLRTMCLLGRPHVPR